MTDRFILSQGEKDPMDVTLRELIAVENPPPVVVYELGGRGEDAHSVVIIATGAHKRALVQLVKEVTTATGQGWFDLTERLILCLRRWWPQAAAHEMALAWQESATADEINTMTQRIDRAVREREAPELLAQHVALTVAGFIPSSEDETPAEPLPAAEASEEDLAPTVVEEPNDAYLQRLKANSERLSDLLRQLDDAKAEAPAEPLPAAEQTRDLLLERMEQVLDRLEEIVREVTTEVEPKRQFPGMSFEGSFKAGTFGTKTVDALLAHMVERPGVMVLGARTAEGELGAALMVAGGRHARPLMNWALQYRREAMADAEDPGLTEIIGGMAALVARDLGLDAVERLGAWWCVAPIEDLETLKQLWAERVSTGRTDTLRAFILAKLGEAPCNVN